MVLATRTLAPNTSLAVIRPKPRPDSPTASEISVIMLKSELPHEAPNPVSKKASRIHRAPRRHGGRVAARGVRARQPAMPVIGFLDSRSSDVISDRLRAFRQGLKE